MTNPAFELHALYASWRGRVTNPGAHSMASILVPEGQGIVEIRRAYALLSSIDGVLRRLSAEGKNVNVFRKQLDGWARVPLSLETGWGTAISPDHVIGETVLEQIESFAAYLEGKVLMLGDAHDQNLRDLIDRADGLLTHEGLDPALQFYIRRLISEIRFALDDDDAGKAFDFSEAVQRLWVAFNAAAEKAPAEDKPKWRALVEQIFVGVVSGGSVEAANIVVGALTGTA